MITLLTGTPGAGKTAYCVGVIIKDAVEEGRLVFTMGIPDLKLAHVPCPPVKEWTELRQPVDGEEEAHHYFTFPEGSLIVVDEAQRLFPARPSSSRVPPHVSAFETHRHTGVDFLLMTQHPQLLDNHVRKLIGRHIHLRDVGFLGRWFYEWPECADPGNFKSALIKKRYKIPRAAFSLYTSASKHIKPIRSFPMALAFVAIALIAVPLLAYRVYSRVQDRVNPEAVTSNEKAKASGSRESSGVIKVDSGEVLAEMIPRVYDRPETAPVYDALRVAKEMPETAGCVKWEGDCSCFTQQGTKALVSVAYCEAWMSGNRPFNPYRTPTQMAQHDPLPSEEKPKGAAVYSAPGENPLWMQPASKPANVPASPERNG